MKLGFKRHFKEIRLNEGEFRFLRFRSTIYGNVVLIIGVSFIVLFILLNLVFRSLYVDFFNTTIRQNGEHISSIVEGALYNSMLENDNDMLQQTLEIISTMSGIDEVNMYDAKNRLVYTSLPKELMAPGNPNCGECHADIASMFSINQKSYRIISTSEECGIHHSSTNGRHLLIREPIHNEKSCYTASCHAHSQDEKLLGSLIINLPLDEIDSLVEGSTRSFFMIALLITGLLLAFLIIFTRKHIKDPLNSIVKASEAVSNGDHSIRVDIHPKSLEDMTKVSVAFNNMLEHIDRATKELENWSRQLEYKVQKKTEELSEAQNELIHVERIASLGKLSSSVAHELNNPLSGILVYTKLISKHLNNPDFYHARKDSILKHLKLIETETKRCGDIVKGLLDFSKKEREDFELINLNELLKESCTLMKHSLKIADIKLTSEFKAENDLIFCSPNQIKQACVAIMVNSKEAVNEHGEINVRTFNPDQNNIQLEIKDNGCGILPEDISHIFEPFFSTKRESSGIGLGLSIVHGIIENHKGRIEVDSEPGKGTTISIILPLQNKDQENG
jgi:two-component system NtrC family sensor kinase